MKLRKTHGLAVAISVLLFGLAGCGLADFAAGQLEKTGDAYRKVLSGNEDEEEESRKKREDRDGEEEEEVPEDKDWDGDAKDTGEEKADESGEAAIREGIFNNGHTVVRYYGNEYYWRYMADSVDPDGIFASFSFKGGAVNQMICRHPDGVQEVLFEAAGYGDIYFAGDRMYLMEEWGKIYSVNLDGSDRIDYNGFVIWDADGEEGIVLGQSAGGPQIIRAENGAMETITEEHAVYAGTVNGYAYYSVPAAAENSLVVYRYKLDGMQAAQEVDRYSLPAEYKDYGASQVYVTQVSVLGDVLYYSYGFYAGTGGFFQMGGINYVEFSPDGQPVNRGVCTSSLLAEEFLAEDYGGTAFLYYMDKEDGINGSYIGFWNVPYESCTRMDVGTLTAEHSDFPLSKPGSIVYINGEMCRARENQAGYDTLIPKTLLDSYGCSGDNLEEAAQVTLIRSVEVVGNNVFFTVEKCSRDQSRDVGWRPGYQRISSERYVMPVGGSQAELLFAY